MVKNPKVGVTPPPSLPEDEDTNRVPPVEIRIVEDDDVVRWGWLGFRPKILQHLLTPKWFLVFVSLFSLGQGNFQYLT